VRAHCRRRLARYKVPKRVIRIDDLPKDAQGKVQKGALARP
jgi:acyl-CoA synthetase (AMP-forming)/AMP-acid ligase II